MKIEGIKDLAGLAAFAHGRVYLLAGGVFTEDIIEAYIETKTEHDVRALDQRPHPHEYILYFDM